jgi:hypothetical protein
MALPSSGRISLLDIAQELRQAENDISLRTLAGLVDDVAPHQMEEFYGYSASSTQFWDYAGSNDRVVWRDSSPQISGSSADISFSFWFRIDLASKDNLLFFDLYPQGASTNANRMFLVYSANINRFIARYRSSSSNFDRHWALHDNSSVTGITNSTTGLVTSQRGNVNGDNFCHIVVTYDGSQSSATNAFKCYWNGTELTTQANNNNGSRSNFNYTEITWGNDYNNGTGDNSGYDHMRLYGKVLSSSEVAAIYNQGTPVNSFADGVTGSLLLEDRAEAATPEDSQGNWTRYASSGSLRTL